MAFDLDRFNAAWRRYTEALTKQHPAFMSYFATGATLAQIAETERTIGSVLPPDVRHLLSLHNGAEAQVLPGWELFSTERIVREWRIWEELRREEFKPDGLTCDPEGPIHGDEWWRLTWIPITGDGGGNHLCADMEPAAGGNVGQIITMWHDDSVRGLIAPSLTEFIEMIAAKVESGAMTWDDEWGGVYEPAGYG
ncbi:SMI1/KNR4 family protein [Terricaulis silvestris]|uniref:SMI1 / KNR4 family protein n=1 Tax=Terricaulis silvestris TaxID=2686094 RepID=A0A6I6MWV4_9CAUL|nr:SMI1/KNR4 family protein [Terricaulis silvestris]QGZ96874.1 SMI1 / KNR4 family protein [Terricaulis silvestris]